ncbi:MFS transporter [Solicola gregarius]|uniref:MFS transporter n=1 Tax=Solicola gregarius TaxID=2908642 RepID=A0AA46TI28_9ACTN|nr:MFS transporter [Solicola gregarius]UYM05752.1 MFS transporter [Solicola gregarius]
MASGGRLGWARPDLPEASVMARTTLANTIGHGMFTVAAVLYFTRIQELPATEVGLGLTISGLFGLAAGIPLGHLSDRVGARELLMVLLVCAGFAAILVPFATQWWSFVVTVSALMTFDRGSAAVRSALIATSVRGPERLRIRAYLRAVNYIGISIGAACGAVALALDSPLAYQIVLILNGVTAWVAAFVMRRYPHVDPTPREAAVPIGRVFRDRSYVLVTLILASTGVQYAILDVGIPLWVNEYTDAPTWIVSVLFVVNTATVVLGQVAISRRIESVRTAARATSFAGLVFLVVCVLISLTDGGSAAEAVPLLLIAGVLHAFGEITQTAAQFCLGQDLAPHHAQGQYQGMATTGFSLSTMLGPAVITLLPIHLGAPGWWILGGAFVLLGLAMIPAVEWSVRTRPAFGVDLA